MNNKATVRIFDNMLNCIMTSVVVNNRSDEMIFTSKCGKTFKFYHEQDCCEDVVIQDIIGDLKDLEGSPMVIAEEVNHEDTLNEDDGTWTFYKFATNKGFVTIRWLGVSNGYYSESVEYEETL